MIFVCLDLAQMLADGSIGASCQAVVLALVGLIGVPIFAHKHKHKHKRTNMAILVSKVLHVESLLTALPRSPLLYPDPQSGALQLVCVFLPLLAALDECAVEAQGASRLCQWVQPLWAPPGLVRQRDPPPQKKAPF